MNGATIFLIFALALSLFMAIRLVRVTRLLGWCLAFAICFLGQLFLSDMNGSLSLSLALGALFFAVAAGTAESREFVPLRIGLISVYLVLVAAVSTLRLS
jgi:hypothetical protein